MGKKVITSVTLEPEVVKTLGLIAEGNRTTVSELVRYIVDKYLSSDEGTLLKQQAEYIPRSLLHKDGKGEKLQFSKENEIAEKLKLYFAEYRRNYNAYIEALVEGENVTADDLLHLNQSNEYHRNRYRTLLNNSYKLGHLNESDYREAIHVLENDEYLENLKRIKMNLATELEGASPERAELEAQFERQQISHAKYLHELAKLDDPEKSSVTGKETIKDLSHSVMEFSLPPPIWKQTKTPTTLIDGTSSAKTTGYKKLPKK